jgi:hypothetical protein
MHIGGISRIKWIEDMQWKMLFSEAILSPWLRWLWPILHASPKMHTFLHGFYNGGYFLQPMLAPILLNP